MDALGINIVNVFIYMLLFTFLYLILDKFLISALLKSLEERKNEVKKGLDASKKAEGIIEEANAEAETQKANTQKEKVKVYDEEKRKVEKQAIEIVKKAEQQADQIIAKARNDMETKQVQMEKDYEEKVSTEAQRVAKEYLGSSEEVSKSAIDKLIKKNL